MRKSVEKSDFREKHGDMENSVKRRKFRLVLRDTFVTVKRIGFTLMLMMACFGAVRLFSGATVADTYSYNLTGMITDNGGNSVGGAIVSATHHNVELGVTTSKDDGTYDLKFETVKQYTGSDLLFIISREGFLKKAVPNIPLVAGEGLVVNFKLNRDYKSLKPDKQAELYRTSDFIEQIEMGRW
jgi:hypothetical protein